MSKKKDALIVEPTLLSRIVSMVLHFAKNVGTKKRIYQRLGLNLAPTRSKKEEEHIIKMLSSLGVEIHYQGNFSKNMVQRVSKQPKSK